MKLAIHTSAAPQAIGTYSQAIRSGDTIYLSGQIGLDPATMQIVEGIDAQIDRVFKNLQAVAAQSSATDRKSTRLNSSHVALSRMPSSA